MTTTPERIGNKAPDWGINYGINELWTEVAPGLFVGGTADDDTVDVARDRIGFGRRFDIADAEITREEFDAVVTMYAFARPVDWGVEELRWGIYDGHQSLPLEEMQETVAWAHRRWKQGKRVLVRCQAGLNRSSLIAALVLVRDGMTPHDAIMKIRRTRSEQALFNTAFTRFIISTPVEAWREGVTPVQGVTS